MTMAIRSKSEALIPTSSSAKVVFSAQSVLTHANPLLLTITIVHKTGHNTMPQKLIRKNTIQWSEVKEYLLSRAESARDQSTVIPRPMCALCDDEELDIAGVPATDPDSVRFEATVLPCGHMFCVPCFNEYKDELSDPSPYRSVYNPICGRAKYTREYRCPVCRADMHHRECRCEVGAWKLPSSDLLDRSVGESNTTGKWVSENMHPGDKTHEETEAVVWVNHHPAVMDQQTREKLVELVEAVGTTMPEYDNIVPDDDNDDEKDEDDSDEEDDEETPDKDNDGETSDNDDDEPSDDEDEEEDSRVSLPVSFSG